MEQLSSNPVLLVLSATFFISLIRYDVYISQLCDGVSYKIRSRNGGRVSDNYSNTIIVGSPNDFGKDHYEFDNDQNQMLTYSLSQNYPIPFNPLTTIAYSLKENSLVILKVFDILGREVAVLVNGVLTGGNHQVQSDRSSLESGMYFYEIRAGNFRDVKKLVLTK